MKVGYTGVMTDSDSPVLILRGANLDDYISRVKTLIDHSPTIPQLAAWSSAMLIYSFLTFLTLAYEIEDAVGDSMRENESESLSDLCNFIEEKNEAYLDQIYMEYSNWSIASLNHHLNKIGEVFGVGVVCG